MLVEIIKTEADQDIARGEIYKNGMLDTRLKLYFDKGVLNSPKVGGRYALSTEWLNYMYKIGKMSAFEI